MISLARITGLLGAYLALIEVALLARLPWLERMVGFDKLTNWHRWNGHACLWLILAHTFLSIWGYQLTDNAFAIGGGHDVLLGRDGADHLGRRLSRG